MRLVFANDSYLSENLEEVKRALEDLPFKERERHCFVVHFLSGSGRLSVTGQDLRVRESFLGCDDKWFPLEEIEAVVYRGSLPQEKKKNDMYRHYREFVGLAFEASQIIRADIDWSVKYDLIFGEFRDRVGDTGVTFEYYDPDTSYEEHVRAYVNAMQTRAEGLKKILESLEAGNE